MARHHPDRYPPDRNPPAPLTQARTSRPRPRPRPLLYATVRLPDGPDGSPRVRVAWWVDGRRRTATLPRRGHAVDLSADPISPERAAVLAVAPPADAVEQRTTPGNGPETRWRVLPTPAPPAPS